MRGVALAGVCLLLASCVSGTPTVVAPTPRSPSPVSPLVIPGGRLLFSVAGVDLWSSATDGTDRRQITHDGSAGGYLGARWSPNGNLIAADRSVQGEEGDGLFLLSSSTGTGPRLTKPDTFLDGFSWSPDGRYLAYAALTSGGTLAAGGSLIGGVGDVHVYDVLNVTDRILGPGTHPAFAPDGARVGYAHASGAIAVTTVDGSQTTFLTTLQTLTKYSVLIAPNGMGLLGGPQWSADGKYVAFAAIERGPILEALQIVYVQEPLAGAPPKMWALGKTGAIHHVAELHWSPTSPLLAYTIINAQPHHHWIGTIDPTDPTAHELYNSTDHFLDYAWSPDGRVILVQVDANDSWIYLVPGREGIARRVTPGGWRPDWCRCPTIN